MEQPPAKSDTPPSAAVPTPPASPAALATIAGPLRPLVEKFFRFASVGALTGAWYAIVVIVLVQLFAIAPTLASVLAYISAIPFSFVGHRRFTFRSNGAVAAEFSRFAIVQAANIAVSYATMQLMVCYFAQPYWTGIALCIAAVPIVTFVIMNTLVFLTQDDRAGTDQSQ